MAFVSDGSAFDPHRVQTIRNPSRRTSSDSGTMMSITMSGERPTMTWSSDLACGTVLGKPSSINPLLASSRFIRSWTIPIITSSLTSSPRSIIALARSPISVPALTASRSMSPVEIFGIPFSFANRSACVPLPAPGGPSIIKFSAIALYPRASTPAGDARTWARRDSRTFTPCGPECASFS